MPALPHLACSPDGASIDGACGAGTSAARIGAAPPGLIPIRQSLDRSLAVFSSRAEFRGADTCSPAAQSARGERRRGRASRLAPGGHDLNPVLGTKDALPGRLRRPPDAWVAIPPIGRGIGDWLRRNPPPGTGARMVCPPTGRGLALRPPAPGLRGGPRQPPVSSPRPTDYSRAPPRRHSPYTYIMNGNSLSPPDSRPVAGVCGESKLPRSGMTPTCRSRALPLPVAKCLKRTCARGHPSVSVAS